MQNVYMDMPVYAEFSACDLHAVGTFGDTPPPKHRATQASKGANDEGKTIPQKPIIRPDRQRCEAPSPAAHQFAETVRDDDGPSVGARDAKPVLTVESLQPRRLAIISHFNATGRSAPGEPGETSGRLTRRNQSGANAPTVREPGPVSELGLRACRRQAEAFQGNRLSDYHRLTRDVRPAPAKPTRWAMQL